MKKFFQIIAMIVAVLAAGMGALLHLKNHMPKGFATWFPKLFAGALTPVWGLAGAVSGLLGLLSGAPLAALFGGWSAYTAWDYLKHVITVTPAGTLEKAFGPQAAGRIPPERAARMLSQRWGPSFPAAPEARVQRDLPFWTLDGGRKLLCDVWQPPVGIRPSGLALLYFHGSAWTMMDKDVGTRTLFGHLAAQGHVVMDAAYRLAPETDMAGMAGDVKRAMVWMKAHAADYAIDPHQVVLMGSSAGGQLSMLVGFSPYHPDMTPADVKDADLSVRAVVSFYGPSDLTACYFHTNQDKTTGHLREVPPPVPPNPEMEARMRRMLGERYERWGMDKGTSAGSFLALLGGHPDQVPEKYALFSPVCHVHPGCPPVFLAQGVDDLIVPVEATRALAGKLQDAGVPVVNLIFPDTDHGFELAMPRLNPAARVAFYELDRFLALML
jgi:acetyl esterase/lipase